MFVCCRSVMCMSMELFDADRAGVVYVTFLGQCDPVKDSCVLTHTHAWRLFLRLYMLVLTCICMVDNIPAHYRDA